MRKNEEKTAETFALLEILRIGDEDIEAGKVTSLTEVVERLRARKR